MAMAFGDVEVRSAQGFSTKWMVTYFLLWFGALVFRMGENKYTRGINMTNIFKIWNITLYILITAKWHVVLKSRLATYGMWKLWSSPNIHMAWKVWNMLYWRSFLDPDYTLPCRSTSVDRSSHIKDEMDKRAPINQSVIVMWHKDKRNCIMCQTKLLTHWLM